MEQESVKASPIRDWSALVPLGMSLAALTLVLAHWAIYGVTRETDEGTAAHVFQLLMTAQFPIVAYFAIKWLPRQTGKALLVLVLQGAAWLVALSTLLLIE